MTFDDTLSDALAVLEIAGPVVETVTAALALAGQPVPEAVSVAVKIAKGVAAAVPEAQALWEQFVSGTTPTQADLDAYAAAEDGAYAKLMAAVDAKLRA